MAHKVEGNAHRPADHAAHEPEPDLRLLLLISVVLLAAVILTACTENDGFTEIEDDFEPIPYSVRLVGAPGDTVERQAEAVLATFRQQSEGAPSVGFLRRRAQNDTETLGTLLRSRGYFSATTDVEVSPPSRTGGPAQVILRISAGPRFELSDHSFTVLNAEPAPDPLNAVDLGSPVGQGAVAEAIIGAEDAAVAFLRRNGYAYARFVNRDAVADPGQSTVRVTSVLDAGKRYDVGAITFAGLDRVEEDYLRTYLTFSEGDTFNAATLPTLEEEYAGTSLFTSLSVSVPDEPPAGDTLPVTITTDERLPRTFGLGLRFDTDVGPEVTSSVTHRNLFGRNETGTISGTVNRELTSIGLDYRVPQFGRNGQDLVFDANFAAFEQDAFSGRTADGSVILERDITSLWRGGLGFASAYSDIVDNEVPQESFLFGPDGFLSYDSTRSRFDPQNGNRARVDVNPFTGAIDEEPVNFIRVDGRVSTFRRINPTGTLVFAARGRLGGIFANDVVDVPSPQRLFAGGGGSVRGFAADAVGPRDDDGDPRGGISVIEAGVELRYRASDLIGLALFTEAGIVDDSPTPDTIGDWRQGIGGGIRFFTPLGPIRADLAAPLDRRPDEDRFQLYLALGQAF